MKTTARETTHDWLERWAELFETILLHYVYHPVLKLTLYFKI